MKAQRVWIALGISGFLVAVVSVALPKTQGAADRGSVAGAYLITIEDFEGNLMSRSVITLHEDQTVSAIDSGQGGPAFHFSSQLGSWKWEGNRRLVGRAISFRLPPDDPAIARTDSVVEFTHNRDRVTGTVTLTLFALEDGNPLDGEGTVFGTFRLVGELIKP